MAVITWILKKIQTYFLPLLTSCILISCSTVGETLTSKQSVSEYAELLFKRQNFLTQQVMMLSEEDITQEYEEKIYQAELKMHDACHLLNEYANREMEGVTMSFFFRKRVQSSFENCEEKVKNMESRVELIKDEEW